MQSTSIPMGYRIGVFELDLRSGDLRKGRRLIRLQEKSRSILIALAERPAELVLRSELQGRLWPADTFVDFEDGLNTAMRKLREALEDDPQSPEYIQTVRGRGYRQVAPVDVIADPAQDGVTAVPELMGVTAESLSGLDLSGGVLSASSSAAQQLQRSLRILFWALLGLALIAITLTALWFTHRSNRIGSGDPAPVLVADFENQTGDPRFGVGLNVALTASLDQSSRVSVYPRLLIASVLKRMEKNPDETVSPSLGMEICQRENIEALILPSILRTGQKFRITVQLVDPASGKTLRTHERNVEDENEMLPAIDSVAADLRHDLGDSRLDIHQQSRNLAQVTTSSLDALQAYSTGQALWNTSRHDEAVALFHKAIQEDPGFAMAHAALTNADYSFAINNPIEGEKEFKIAIDLGAKTSERERDVIAIKYARSQKRRADALSLYRDYLQRYPADWDAQYGYAYTLRISGREKEAFDIYSRLIEHAQSYAPLYIELATASKGMNQIPQAIAFYQRAFAVDPGIRSTGNISREYGAELMRNNQFDLAATEFASDADNPASREQGEVSLAMLDLYRGRYESARTRLEAALTMASSPLSTARVRYLLAEIASGEGKREEQITQLDRIRGSLDQLKIQVIYGAFLGQAYARAGEVSKAQEVLSFITPLANIRIDEQASYLQILRAEIKAAEGDPRAVIQLLPPLAQISDNSVRSLTVEGLAHFNQMAGRYPEAIVWYERFAQDSNRLMWEPQQRIFAAYYLLAQDYMRQGNRTDAKRNIDQLLTLWSGADSTLQLKRDAQRLQLK